MSSGQASTAFILPIAPNSPVTRNGPRRSYQALRIGQNQFGCYVCANTPKAESSGWLYDLTWLEYTSHDVGLAQTGEWLVDTHLVAECEWASSGRSIGEIDDDFSKLLLARASMRLMVCFEWGEGWHHNEIKNAKDLANHLGEQVRRFNGTRAEDCYLLPFCIGTKIWRSTSSSISPRLERRDALALRASWKVWERRELWLQQELR